MNMQELKQQSFDNAELRGVWYNSTLDADSPVKVSKEHRAIYNVQKGSVAAIVSPQYKLLQHSEVISAVADAITGLNIKAAARIGNDGNKIFVDIEFPDSKLFVKVGEEFVAGIRIVNSYDKTTGVMVLPRLKRLACSNGMVIDVGICKTFRITHVQHLKEDFASAVEKMLADLITNTPTLKNMVNACIGDSIEWELLDKIIGKLAWAEKHREAVKEKLKGITKPTRWDLYNAFTSYATHGTQIKPNVENELQKRAKIVFTNSSKALVAMATED